MQKDEMFFAYKEGFDVSIIRKDGIEAMFFFDKTSKIFIHITKLATTQNQEKIDEINSTYSNIHAEYRKENIVITMTTQENVIEQYLFGLKLLEEF